MGCKRSFTHGYHTANLMQNVMIVVCGGDGHECSQDNGISVWTHTKLYMPHRRLSHSSAQVGSYSCIFGRHGGVDILDGIGEIEGGKVELDSDGIDATVVGVMNPKE